MAMEETLMATADDRISLEILRNAVRAELLNCRRTGAKFNSHKIGNELTARRGALLQIACTAGEAYRRSAAMDEPRHVEIDYRWG
jgi:hypothetical protein